MRVFDLEERAGLRRLVMGRQHRNADRCDFAGLRIDLLAVPHGHDHPLDAEVAEARPRWPETVRAAVADELDATLGGLHGDPVADGILAAQTALVLEDLGELVDGVEPPLGRLLEQDG